MSAQNGIPHWERFKLDKVCVGVGPAHALLSPRATHTHNHCACARLGWNNKPIVVRTALAQAYINW